MFIIRIILFRVFLSVSLPAFVLPLQGPAQPTCEFNLEENVKKKSEQWFGEERTTKTVINIVLVIIWRAQIKYFTLANGCHSFSDSGTSHNSFHAALLIPSMVG